MAVLPTAIASTGTNTPGASTQDTASLTPVNGNGYLVAIYNTATTAPSVTLSGAAGWNVTWTSVGDVALSTGRRLQVFRGKASSNSAGVLTISYASTPDSVDWIVINCGQTGPNVIVTSNIQVSSPPDTFATTTLWELLTLNVAAKVGNVPLMIIAGNTNNGTPIRFELAADSGGDADWTLISRRTSSTPTRTLAIGGRLDFTDRTPGVFANASTTGGAIAVEIDAGGHAINRLLKSRANINNTNFY